MAKKRWLAWWRLNAELDISDSLGFKEGFDPKEGPSRLPPPEKCPWAMTRPEEPLRREVNVTGITKNVNHLPVLHSRWGVRLQCVALLV